METSAANDSEDISTLSTDNSEDYSNLSDIERVDAFYKEYTSTIDIKELAEKYGLFTDSKSSGTGTKWYKVAATKEDAKLTSNADLNNGTYFVLIEEDQSRKNFSSQIVDNRNPPKKRMIQNQKQLTNQAIHP